MNWNTFKNIDYKWHLLIAFTIRIIFILYGVYHDENYSVPYTDVDYKVFTDASRHIINNKSPYERHTYRYSPLIALILIPNIILHPLFGKILFSIVDLVVALLIRAIVKNTFKEYECFKQKSELKSLKGNGDVPAKPNFKYVRQRKKSKNHDRYEKNTIRFKSDHDIKSDISMMVWLYNPMTIAIATRGNADSIAGLLVLSTIYCLQYKRNYFMAGVMHGVSIHLRLYPLIYSLAYFMYLSKYSYYTTNRFKYANDEFYKTECRKLKQIKNMENEITQNINKDVTIRDEVPEKRTIFKKEFLLYLIPNMDQCKLIMGCIISLTTLTYLFYYMYGYQFLYETYIYHVVRKDTRHNFSLFFYLQYLTAGVKNIGLWQRILIVLPQMILLLVFSIRYGLNKFSINFSILVQTITMVTYNTVLTSQYFVWVLVVLPLCLWQIKATMKTAIFLTFIWFAAQAAWLMPAYFLEFQGQNTFLFIWLQSVSFFCANIAILGRLIMNYMPLKKVKV